jgi:hypothetical protein
MEKHRNRVEDGHVGQTVPFWPAYLFTGWEELALETQPITCIEKLTSIDDTKLFRVGAPCEIMYRTFLVKGDPAIKVASSTQKIHPSLAVITLVRVVDFSLG